METSQAHKGQTALLWAAWLLKESIKQGKWVPTPQTWVGSEGSIRVGLGASRLSLRLSTQGLR